MPSSLLFLDNKSDHKTDELFIELIHASVIDDNRTYSISNLRSNSIVPAFLFNFAYVLHNIVVNLTQNGRIVALDDELVQQLEVLGVR